MPLEIALVGQQIIHAYPLVPRFNGCDLAKVEQFGRGWAQKAGLDTCVSPLADDIRVTRVWSPDTEEAQHLSEALFIKRICRSLEEALDGAHGVLVMDEAIESRTALVEQCLHMGLTVFADKVLSVDPGKTDQLLALAQTRNTRVRSWSQLFFHPDLARVRQAPPGGVAFLNFQMKADILSLYGIHVISMLQGAFAGRARAYRPLADGECREGLVELDDGSRVFLHVGPNLPFRGRLYYCAPDCEVIVNRNDDAACFENAACALMALFTGQDTPAGPGVEEMSEASRLLACIVRGGSDGRPVSIEKPDK